MNIEEIDVVLELEAPSDLITQTYNAREQELVIAFTCDGGPREDQAYIVRFEEAILFHLPAVLHDEVRVREATEGEREQLIPEESYDPLEVSGAPGAFTVVLFAGRDGRAFGYYVAARSVSGEWLPASLVESEGEFWLG